MEYAAIHDTYEGLSMLAECQTMEKICVQLYSEAQMLCNEIIENDGFELYSEAEGESKGFFGKMFDSIKNFLKKIKDFVLKIIRSVMAVILKPFGVKWAFLEGDKFAGGVKSEGGGGGGGGGGSSSSSSSSSPVIETRVENIPGFDSVDISVSNVTDMVVKYGQAVAKAREGLAADGANVLTTSAYKAYINTYPVKNNTFINEFKNLNAGDIANKAAKLKKWTKDLSDEIREECKDIKMILMYELDKAKKTHLEREKDTNAAYANLFMSNQTVTDPLSMFNLNAVDADDDICAFFNTSRVHTHDGDKVGIINIIGSKASVEDSALVKTGQLVLNGVMGGIESYINIQSAKTKVEEVAKVSSIAYRMEKLYTTSNGAPRIDAKDLLTQEGGTIVRKLVSAAGTKGDGSDCKLKNVDRGTAIALAGVKNIIDDKKRENVHTAKEFINNKALVDKLNKVSMDAIGMAFNVTTFDTKKDFYSYIKFMQDLTLRLDPAETISIYNEYMKSLKAIEDKNIEFGSKDKEGNDKEDMINKKAGEVGTPEEVKKKISAELKGELADLKLLSTGIIGSFKDAVKIVTIIQVNALSAVMNLRLLSLDMKLALAYHALGALSDAAKTTGAKGSGPEYIKDATTNLVNAINIISNSLKVKTPN